MKIALICPSNMLYMPYVNNYEIILQKNLVQYEIINWDRFHIEDKDHPFKYRDSKIGHQRNVLDYYRFSKFISKKIKSDKYDKVIIFGIQMVFFLKDILLNEYTGKFILDIRDHNKIVRFFNIKRIIENSSFTVISSPGYKEWLPQSNKYIVNHNTQVNSLEDLKEMDIKFKDKKIEIANIGAIRDYSINIGFINSLINSSKFNLYFHGEGNINKNISRYLETNNIKNVYLTGRYDKDDEIDLYKQSDLINLLVPNNHINNRTLLPNRLYNAALYAKPAIAYEGTYLADQIRFYNLGMIINSFDGIEKNIRNYISNIDEKTYRKGRTSFFENIIKENCYFITKMQNFIGV